MEREREGGTKGEERRGGGVGNEEAEGISFYE